MVNCCIYPLVSCLEERLRQTRLTTNNALSLWMQQIMLEVPQILPTGLGLANPHQAAIEVLASALCIQPAATSNKHQILSSTVPDHGGP